MSSLYPSAREFPDGRFGYREFIYEVRTPLKVSGKRAYTLVLGLSKSRIDEHIAEVSRGVRLKVLATTGAGFMVLIVPAVVPWVVLRRHRRWRERLRKWH